MADGTSAAAERLAERHAHHLKASGLWDRAMRLKSVGVPVVPALMMRRLRSRYGADLPLWTRRPSELYLMHNALGIVIHPQTQFEGPAVVFHQTTFGNAWSGDNDGAPTISEHVFVGAGAKLLGAIRVGPFSVIGANAVVTRDVPEQHVLTADGRCTPIDKAEMLRRFFAYDELT